MRDPRLRSGNNKRLFKTANSSGIGDRTVPSFRFVTMADDRYGCFGFSFRFGHCLIIPIFIVERREDMSGRRYGLVIGSCVDHAFSGIDDRAGTFDVPLQFFPRGRFTLAGLAEETANPAGRVADRQLDVLTFAFVKF